jgi:hypothetical protein
MSSEVFLNSNVAFLLPFLTDLLILYPTVKKNFNLHKKFPEKTYFFYNITFSRSSKRPSRHYQQKAFFKTLIDLSLNFFQKLCVSFSFGCFQTFWTHCINDPKPNHVLLKFLTNSSHLFHSTNFILITYLFLLLILIFFSLLYYFTIFFKFLYLLFTYLSFCLLTIHLFSFLFLYTYFSTI